MRVKLSFMEKGEEKFFSVKPEFSELYFCALFEGNHKTSQLLKHLMKSSVSWISIERGLEGTVTSERWVEVDGEIEEWLIKKVEEFSFLLKH